MDYQIINDNCSDILPTLPKTFAIVTDPPYGIRTETDNSRFTGGSFRNYAKRLTNKDVPPDKVVKGKDHPPIYGDDKLFDPTPLLRFKYVSMFGANYFHLPIGSSLIWIKKRKESFGTFLSDAEIAWMNRGKGVYCFSHVWSGCNRESEHSKSLHPTQKPIEVMKWMISKMKLPIGTTIVDPYMGSGATGIAALQLGYSFIGIEMSKAYCDISLQRINEMNRPEVEEC